MKSDEIRDKNESKILESAQKSDYRMKFNFQYLELKVDTIRSKHDSNFIWKSRLDSIQNPSRFRA